MEYRVDCNFNILSIHTCTGIQIDLIPVVINVREGGSSARINISVVEGSLDGLEVALAASTFNINATSIVQLTILFRKLGLLTRYFLPL